jgi:UDP-N-acetylmuramoyl-tripeptide--D-alanyl-D-alanine ligase
VVFQADVENRKKIESLAIKFPHICFVETIDMIKFTQDLSQLHARSWQKAGGYIFAISGSNGKTTHKEMLSFILENIFPGLIESTQKNNNNHLGVPLTLLQIKPNTKCCIIELGSNHPGEIKFLCDLSLPDAGLVTNIGATHLEFFETLENVFKEEGYLYHHLISKHGMDAQFFLNADDVFLSTLPKTKRTINYSTTKKDVDFQIDIIPPKVKIRFRSEEIVLENHFITGKHNFMNLATTWLIAFTLYPAHKNELVHAASLFRPTFNRSEWKKWREFEVFLDAYNANPSSMKLAIEGYFDEMQRRGVAQNQCCLIIGDMYELGPKSPQFHEELGREAARWPQAKWVFVGRYSDDYGRGFGYPCIQVKSVQALKENLWPSATSGATHLFIKGSRSLQLESLLAIT